MVYLIPQVVHRGHIDLTVLQIHSHWYFHTEAEPMISEKTTPPGPPQEGPLAGGNTFASQVKSQVLGQANRNSSPMPCSGKSALGWMPKNISNAD